MRVLFIDEYADSICWLYRLIPLPIDLNTSLCSKSFVKRSDRISERIISLINSSKEPLETIEIIKQVNASRVKTLYRLYILRGDGIINGKQVGSGKGTWIWWKNER